MKIVRVNNTTTVVLNDGTSFQRELTDEEFAPLMELSEDDDEQIKRIMIPEYDETMKEWEDFNSLEEKLENSVYLTKKGDSVYWEEVCELSMPKELIKKVLECEENEDYEGLEAYKNFWTLLSLNPDSRCRQNLLWFLIKYGMQISKYGLFVGYRNADILERGPEDVQYDQDLIDFVKFQYERIKHNKKSPKKYMIEEDTDGELNLIKYDYDVSDKSYSLCSLYELFSAKNFDFNLINPSTETIYTDHHSHTFRFKIGELVSMPRQKCDSVQENSCSTGLHIGGASWLTENYFGEQGLACLVNPADVVAVPPIDDYGKLRTCAYLPIGTVNFDEFGHVIPYNVKDGFKSKYVHDVLYSGTKYAEETAAYEFIVPDIPEINRDRITANLKAIAQECINSREL